jgi:hypothetical protein
LHDKLLLCDVCAKRAAASAVADVLGLLGNVWRVLSAAGTGFDVELVQQTEIRPQSDR